MAPVCIGLFEGKKLQAKTAIKSDTVVIAFRGLVRLWPVGRRLFEKHVITEPVNLSCHSYQPIPAQASALSVRTISSSCLNVRPAIKNLALGSILAM
jgi:hypothetical protein